MAQRMMYSLDIVHLASFGLKAFPRALSGKDRPE
jgi:hypothetical protein